MSRRSTAHGYSSLCSLADDLAAASDLVREVAVELKKAKVVSVKVNHQMPITHGLAAVPLFVNDVRTKILYDKMESTR